mgnify:FL=1
MGVSLKAQDIPKFPKGLMKKAGEKAKSLIIEDADNGIFQNNQKKLSYSEPYATLKQGSMRRSGRGLKKKGKGTRFKAFKGKSLNTETAFVNMRLTGQTLRRIAVKTIKDGFKLVFANGGIVEGNANRGYVLDDLRDENYLKIEKMLGIQLDRNIKKYTQVKMTLPMGE